MPPQHPQRPGPQPAVRPLALHVQAALGVAQPQTPAPPPGTRPPAPHVQAAVGNARTNGNPLPPRWYPPQPVQPATQDKKDANATPPGSSSQPPRRQKATQPQTPNVPSQVNAALKHHAPHVRAAILRTMTPKRPGVAKTSVPASAIDYVVYGEKKLGGAPPPPPRRPVYALHVGNKGKNCTIRSLETGQVKEAGSLFAGFVRMRKDGDIYISLKAGVGAPGDSHATIAARSPEWAAGQRVVVAGGEVGLINSEIVGYNDKTGHFQTRKNQHQAGMPSDKFYPFTVDPKDWYKNSRARGTPAPPATQRPVAR